MKKYSVILALALAMVLAMGISTAFAAGGADATSDAYTTTTVNGEVYVAVPGTLADPSDGLADNANATGLAPIRKNVAGQDVHGEYKKNTNSCASCHVTHNAPGAKLLFKNSTYNTCTACHDGTLGFLNVFQTADMLQTNLAKVTDANKKPYAMGGGTFRYEANAGFSMHMANGAVTLSAAPGGNRTSTSTARGAEQWGAAFSCASCHAPHGGYSSRLLHYNPNNYSINKIEYTGVVNGVTQAVYWGGKQLNVALVGETLDVTGDGVAEEVWYVEGKIADANDVDGDGDVKELIANPGFANRVATPWIYGYNSHTLHDYYTLIYVNGTDHAPSGDRWNSEVHMNYGGAYFIDDADVIAAGDIVTADISPALVTKFNYDEEDHKIYGYGDKAGAVNKFCGTCHSEYNTVSVAGTEKIFDSSTAAHRHTINRSGGNGIVGSVNDATTGQATQLECLSCHYAHGTSKEIQLYADNTFVLAADAADMNPSSALKRYINQAVCFRCHTSSSAAAIKNDAGFWNGEGDGSMVYDTLGDMAGYVLP